MNCPMVLLRSDCPANPGHCSIVFDLICPLQCHPAMPGSGDLHIIMAFPLNVFFLSFHVPTFLFKTNSEDGFVSKLLFSGWHNALRLSMLASKYKECNRDVHHSRMGPALAASQFLSQNVTRLRLYRFHVWGFRSMTTTWIQPKHIWDAMREICLKHRHHPDPKHAKRLSSRDLWPNTCRT